MTSTEQKSNILKFKKQKQLNIGIIIFGIIFVYLLATIIMYVTAPRITVYEVRQGSILKDTAYTGLAIRDESIVYADGNGYVNYYVEDSSKVRVGTNVYTISSQQLEFENTVSTEALVLTNEEQSMLQRKVQTFNEQFKESEFSYVYQFKNEMGNSLGEMANQSKLDQLNALLSSGNTHNMTVKPSTEDGVIVLSVDGMESVTEDNASVEQLSKTDYKKIELTNNMQIASGDPVYKIITDEHWSLLVEITAETAETLQEKKYVKVNFKKDNKAVWADLTLTTKEGKNIACLSFEDSMVRYADERYLDIELVLEDESGLKIPKSSETTKDFYIVPKSYVTQGGNSSDDGVMRQQTDKNGKSITEFLSVTVYYEEDEYVYLDPNVFEEGDVLLKPDSTEVYPLKEMKSLKGVYCINKGYAVFKQIKILCESDEYYIIEEGNSFGLSNYDHIALDSQNIKENDVVF